MIGNDSGTKYQDCMMTTLDAFTLAYLEAALWSSSDDSGDFLDKNYGVQDIAPATLEQMVADWETVPGSERGLHHRRQLPLQGLSR